MADTTELGTRFGMSRGGLGLSRRWLGAWIVGVAVNLCIWQNVLADEPATQPMSDDTPRAFAQSATNDHLAPMSIDDAMALVDFDPNSPADVRDARLLAESSIETSKLEVAVRGKWGKSAETIVAHACSDNLPDDVAMAQWTINGDHAQATFQNDRLGPLLLVDKDGHWKLDMYGYRKLSGDQFEPSLNAAIPVDKGLIQDLNNDAYPTADTFEKHVMQEMDKLEGGN